MTNCRPCFNPRPPRKVGATRHQGWQRSFLDVSILAHLARWALRRTDSTDGRGKRVSILAHLARWALRETEHPIHYLLQFQSSPTSQGGRYLAPSSVPRWDLCFNPRPPRKVGATQPRQLRLLCRGVSILAHLARWALHAQRLNITSSNLFQSSPTSQGGRYLGAWAVGMVTVPVSILAHLARWALHSPTD